MSHDAIEFLLRALDEPTPGWDGGAIRGWPQGRFERLRELNLLVPGPAAASVVCTNCDHGHVEAVTYVGGRPHIGCIEGGVVNLDPDALRTWVPDRAAIASLLRRVIQAKDRLRELVPGRLWQLGSVRWEGVSRKVMFATGLHWGDAARVAAIVGPAGKPIVLVPSALPIRDIWPGLAPPVAPLADLLTDEANGVTIESSSLLSVVREADQLNAASLQGALADPKLKSSVRRAVKAEIKHRLEDEDLVKAYELHGSADKAAAAILAATGVRIERKKFYRALDREQKKKLTGGKGAAAESARVPSRTRDKPRK